MLTINDLIHQETQTLRHRVRDIVDPQCAARSAMRDVLDAERERMLDVVYPRNAIEALSITGGYQSVAEQARDSLSDQLSAALNSVAGADLMGFEPGEMLGSVSDLEDRLANEYEESLQGLTNALIGLTGVASKRAESEFIGLQSCYSDLLGYNESLTELVDRHQATRTLTDQVRQQLRDVGFAGLDTESLLDQLHQLWPDAPATLPDFDSDPTLGDPESDSDFHASGRHQSSDFKQSATNGRAPLQLPASVVKYERARITWVDTLHIALSVANMWQSLHTGTILNRQLERLNRQFDTHIEHVRDAHSAHTPLRALDTLTVRKAPHLIAGMKGIVSAGERLDYMDRSGDWARVRYFDAEDQSWREGWVRWDGVTIEPPPPDQSIH